MRSETSYPYEERDPIREDRQREAYFEALADAQLQANAEKEKPAKPKPE
jgi:hypothetical protein